MNTTILQTQDRLLVILDIPDLNQELSTIKELDPHFVNTALVYITLDIIKTVEARLRFHCEDRNIETRLVAHDGIFAVYRGTKRIGTLPLGDQLVRAIAHTPCKVSACALFNEMIEPGDLND